MPSDLALLLPLLGLTALYLSGVRRLRPDRRPSVGAQVRGAVAVITLLVALGPAMEAAAARTLSWHMVQHQLLVLVVAPLLATSGAGRALQAAVVRGRQDRSPRAASPAPALVVAAAALHLGIMVVWHVPALYELALMSPEVHHLEHLTMLGTAVLAWSLLLAASQTASGTPAAIAGFALLAVGGAALGVLLLSTPASLYPSYGEGVAALTDQRAAGALMKVGSLLVFAGAAAGIAARWLLRLEEHTDTRLGALPRQP